MAATYEPFPVISIEGDAHACGVQHGQQAAERVARTIDFYLGVFSAKSKLSLADVRERARGFLAQIEAIDTDIVAELKGIAEGARQQLEDVIAVNCRTELMYGSSQGSRAATECTRGARPIDPASPPACVRDRVVRAARSGAA